jgi:hypothetical protein
MSNFCYILPAHKLKRDTKIIKLVQTIFERASEIPNYGTLKGDQEFLKFICLMIEHGIDNSKKKCKKIDKKDICLTVYKKLYSNITPADLEQISNNIEYLIENGQIIKKSIFKIIKSTVIDFIKRKLA